MDYLYLFFKYLLFQFILLSTIVIIFLAMDLGFMHRAENIIFVDQNFDVWSEDCTMRPVIDSSLYFFFCFSSLSLFYTT